MKKGILIVVLSVVCSGFGAPVDIKQESKRRETTRETLELENALKVLAGENKKFFPGPGLQPVPQVDGLEDHPEDELVASLPGEPREQDGEGNTLDEPSETDESEEQPDQTDNSNTESNEEQEAEDEQYLDQLSQKIDSDTEDGSEQAEEIAEESAERLQHPSDFDDASHYEQPSSYVEQQQQGLADSYPNPQYGQDYPAYGDMGGGANEDYLVQDVMDMMEKHPELWARLLQARNMNEVEEDAEPQYGNIYDQSQYQIPDREQQDDSVEDIQDDPRYRMPPQNEIYNNEEALRKMEQYEKLQEFYGDKEAHVVAKKQGYGPMVDYPQLYPNEMFGQQQLQDQGSGESDIPRNANMMNEEPSEALEHVQTNNNIPIFKVPVM